MPNFACNKCGKIYNDDKSINTHKKCEYRDNISIIDNISHKKAPLIRMGHKKLAKVTYNIYIALIMVFMPVLAGILIFVAASSIFDPAELYDVKCPNCNSQNVKFINEHITNQSISPSGLFYVYL